MSKTILVIEDEQYIRENIVEMLEVENYNVYAAENGKVGVDLAQKTIPDLILCDVMMPELDGYYVLSELRSNSATQTIPLIFLTAKTTREDMRLGMDLGADDYLTKPFTRDELLGTVTTRIIKQVAVERKTQEKLDKLRNSISQSLPQEFRIPLNGIISLSQFLREEFDTIDKEEALELLEEIYFSGQRLHRLTQNFLLYAKLVQIQSHPRRFKMLQELKEEAQTEEIIAAIAREKAKELKRKDDLRLDLCSASVSISLSKIKKITEEIIDNAFKFSQAGTLVKVETRHDNNTFHLVITDRGRGMTTAQINQLGAYLQFERHIYEQQGSGLGLTIAKLMIELHGGTMSIESTPGKYTSIHITLPSKPTN
ncbi:MAG: response regulator [Xenococcaceae cyanobacterium MO_188.B32]|nr:response regulator [Xenococcaceae cyanobacterium MO_188.B32]